MEKYKLGKFLGYGSFGDVSLVEIKKTKILFAMKRIQRGEMIDDYVAREIINQKLLYHPNVIQFKEARYFFQQLLSSVSYLHSKDICHRDLKPRNILLDGSNPPCLKICDFGFSKSGRLHSKPKSAVVTPKYSAPEICSGVYDGKLADVWSCGVTLYTMSDGINLENDTGETNSLSQDCKDLLTLMLVVDPRKRITIEDVKKHPCLKRKLKMKLAEASQVKKENPRFSLQSDEEIEIIVEEAKIPPPEDAESEEEDEDSSCGN